MRWLDVLTLWKYPKPTELAAVLEDLGLDPSKYTYPWELARDLRMLIDAKRKMIYVRGEWRPLAWYDPIIEFFKWLWDRLKEVLYPYMKYVILILLGAGITYIASGWYKALGVIPIAIAVYFLLKEFGLI